MSKTQDGNTHLANGTTAKFTHIDGSKTQVIPRSTAGRLLRVVINTAGINFVIRNGSEVAGIVSATATGTLNFGVWCNANITIDVITGTGSATIVHDR